MLYWSGKYVTRDLFAFIEKAEGVIVATALLLVIEKPSSPHFMNGRVGNVLNVYTVPEYRRKGISTKLMKELIHTGRVLGLDDIELLSTSSGHPLYQRLGFGDHVPAYQPMRLYL